LEKTFLDIYIISMSETNGSTQPKKQSLARKLVLLLALVTSPLACCGCSFLLDALPASFLPPAVSFIVGTFEAEARVENRSGETLHLTPFSTTTGRLVVIKQPTSLRQRDIPLSPNNSIVFTYDAADMPLAGIAVCRTSGDCRWIETDYSNEYYLDSFEALPELESGWLQAMQSQPQYSFDLVVMPLLGLVPVVLFLAWLYWGYTRK
jgi:hypothetical protein